MEIPELKENEKQFVKNIKWVFIDGDPTDEDGKYNNAKFPYIIFGPEYDNLFRNEIGLYLGKLGSHGISKKNIPEELSTSDLKKIIENMIGHYSYYNSHMFENYKNIDINKTKKMPIYVATKEWKEKLLGLIE